MLAQRLAALAPAPRETLQWIKASIGSVVRLIPIEDVLYFMPTTGTGARSRPTAKR